MAYMRGFYYLWCDDRRCHLWARDGYDEWDGSIWGTGTGLVESSDGAELMPSGVALPQDVLDEYVVMRLAELVSEGVVEDTITRALERHRGNGGCGALADHAGALARALAPLGSGPPAP